MNLPLKIFWAGTPGKAFPTMRGDYTVRFYGFTLLRFSFGLIIRHKA